MNALMNLTFVLLMQLALILREATTARVIVDTMEMDISATVWYHFIQCHF